MDPPTFHLSLGHVDRSLTGMLAPRSFLLQSTLFSAVRMTCLTFATDQIMLLVRVLQWPLLWLLLHVLVHASPTCRPSAFLFWSFPGDQKDAHNLSLCPVHSLCPYLESQNPGIPCAHSSEQGPPSLFLHRPWKYWGGPFAPSYIPHYFYFS